VPIYKSRWISLPLAIVFCGTQSLALIPQSAFAAGQCACIGTSPAVHQTCGPCIGGNCTSDWVEISPYSICDSCETGREGCQPSGTQTVGTEGDCARDISWWGVASCAGAGCVAAAIACALKCTATGTLWWACVLGCCAAGGGAGAITCCASSCICVDDCYADEDSATPVVRPQPQLYGTDCPPPV
jgi:hypothetical protein